MGSKSQSPAHFTRVNKKLIKLGFNLAKHPFEHLPIPVVTVMTVVVMAARGWWPPLLSSVTGCGRSDGVAYQSFLSLTVLRLGVQALVAGGGGTLSLSLSMLSCWELSWLLMAKSGDTYLMVAVVTVVTVQCMEGNWTEKF